MCERYDALSEQWEKRLERLERKAKDHKTRELFEKVFPELKRIKEPSEKLNRTDSRGIGIIRSEAELNELMDALNEQEEVSMLCLLGVRNIWCRYASEVCTCVWSGKI